PPGGAPAPGALHGGGVALDQATGLPASAARQCHALLHQAVHHVRRCVVYRASGDLAGVAPCATSRKTAMSRYPAPPPAADAPVALGRRGLSGQSAKVEIPESGRINGAVCVVLGDISIFRAARASDSRIAQDSSSHLPTNLRSSSDHLRYRPSTSCVAWRAEARGLAVRRWRTWVLI